MAVCTGLYLPLTAVLGGLLFVRPEGYAEAQRDVVRLTSDEQLLPEQEGYITCEPLEPEDGGPSEPLPLLLLPLSGQARAVMMCSQPSPAAARQTRRRFEWCRHAARQYACPAALGCDEAV